MELYRDYNGIKYQYAGTFPKSRKFIVDYKWCIKNNGGRTKVQVINNEVTFWNKW